MKGREVVGTCFIFTMTSLWATATGFIHRHLMVRSVVPFFLMLPTHMGYLGRLRVTWKVSQCSVFTCGFHSSELNKKRA